MIFARCFQLPRELCKLAQEAALKPPGEEARVLGEEARRRLSGHGFSTEGREERRMSRSEFPRWGNERADEPKPEPRWGEPPGLVPQGAGAEGGLLRHIMKITYFDASVSYPKSLGQGWPSSISASQPHERLQE